MATVSGCPATLAFFKQAGVQTFLCSSTTRELLRTFVATHGLDESFTDLFGYDGRLCKDRQLREILRKHGLRAREVVFVGDSLHDRAFSQRIGITFIGIQRSTYTTNFRARGIPMVASLEEFEATWHRSRYLRAATAPT